MSSKADTLADQFTQANDELIAAIEGLSPDKMLTMCDGEGRTVAALARHVADGHAYLIDTFVGMANGQPGPDMNQAALNAYNAQTGEQHAVADKDETIQILKQHGASAAERVRGLSDDQLTRSGKLLSDGPSMPVEQWIEHVLIGHPRSHLASIRAALGQTA